VDAELTNDTDLETATGEIIPTNIQVQSPAVPALTHDVSQIITREGEQLVSVGSHWPLTGPLPAEMREKVERTGLCMGCHEEMTNEELWPKVSTPGWVNNEAHRKVMNKAVRQLGNSGK